MPIIQIRTRRRVTVDQIAYEDVEVPDFIAADSHAAYAAGHAWAEQHPERDHLFIDIPDTTKVVELGREVYHPGDDGDMTQAYDDIRD